MYEDLFEIKESVSENPVTSSLRIADFFGEQHSKARDRIKKLGVPHTAGACLSPQGALLELLWLDRTEFHQYLVNKNGDQARAMCKALGLAHKTIANKYVKKADRK